MGNPVFYILLFLCRAISNPLLKQILINQHYGVKSLNKTGYEGKPVNAKQAMHVLNKVLPASNYEVIEIKWER